MKMNVWLNLCSCGTRSTDAFIQIRNDGVTIKQNKNKENKIVTFKKHKKQKQKKQKKHSQSPQLRRLLSPLFYGVFERLFL